MTPISKYTTHKTVSIRWTGRLCLFNFKSNIFRWCLVEAKDNKVPHHTMLTHWTCIQRTRLHLLSTGPFTHSISEYLLDWVDGQSSLLLIRSQLLCYWSGVSSSVITTVHRGFCPLPSSWTRPDAPCGRAALFVCVERLEMAESRDQSDNLGLQMRVRRHWNTETARKWSRELLTTRSCRWDTSRTRRGRIYRTRFGFSKLVS